MKKHSLIINVCSLLFVAVGLNACADEELKTYEDVPRIFFKFADTSSSDTENKDDNRTVNMGYDRPLKDDSIVKIPVKLMGRVETVDRPIKVEVIKEESTAIEGEDFEILSAFLPADSIYGSVDINLKRTDRIANATLLVRIRLVANEYFHTDFTSVSQNSDNSKSGLVYNLFFTALADRPGLWSAPSSSKNLEMLFGSYSNVKMNVICEACGVDREFFDLDPEDNDPSGLTTFSKRFPIQKVYGMISAVNRYLAKYKSDNGEPLLDEKGNEVKMGWSHIL